MYSEEYNPVNFGFGQMHPALHPALHPAFNRNNNLNSIISTNIPLPENASQNNRNARGMDVGVKRINYDVIRAFQDSFTESLLKSKELQLNEFMDFIAPVDAALDKSFLIQHLKNFDKEWFRNSINYVHTLPNKDKFMLRAYTRNGDKLIN